MLLIVVPITLIPSSVLMSNGALSLTLIALPLALVDVTGGILDSSLTAGLVVCPITLGWLLRYKGGIVTVISGAVGPCLGAVAVAVSSKPLAVIDFPTFEGIWFC